MARFGMEAGDRGTLETRTTGRGVLQGFFIPRDTPRADTEPSKRLAAGVKVAEVDTSKGVLRIFPTDTRSWDNNFLGPKYQKIVKITLGQSQLGFTSG